MFTTDTGVGHPVLLIPGLGATHEMYRPQIETLSDHLRVLAPDLRGCGASGSLGSSDSSEVIDMQVRDLLHWLDDLGISRVHAVGISYGGAVVERMMITHADRVCSAVICDSLCTTRGRTVWESLTMAPARLQPLMLRMPRRWLAASFAGAYKRWPEAGRQMAQVVLHGNVEDLILQRRAINSIDYEDELRHVSTPTLCLVGDHSRLAISMMRRTHAAIRGSQFAIIPNSFDPSSLCQPELFSHAVLTWVETHS